MSNETKREVFDELLKMYRNSMALTHEEPVILDNDGYDIFGKIEKSYADALPDETDKQKNCPYCHETDPQSKHAHYGKAMSDKTEYFDFIRKHKLYRRVKARIKSPEDQHPKLCVTQMNRFREVSVVLDKAISYCPICGRKL
ncbi:hypothetical protein [Lacticaseibacillus paracasei]|uniref:hypothetical protein n=1 Tax=Lacticaseibacillus paracasei TaxID=1597 RepID=UPI000FF75900|nr:hypothetical protein [Lacticaseibacillus paracasei]RND62549.1 hypothetical protein FAM18123_01059 [Lacticaseibacillus paracasei]